MEVVGTLRLFKKSGSCALITEESAMAKLIKCGKKTGALVFIS